MKTTIKYYTQNIYGVRREKFIDKGQESVFIQLTGRKTLDSVSRELIRDLSGSQHRPVGCSFRSSVVDT